MAPSQMAPRLDAVRNRMADMDADAMLLTFLPNIRWAVGFTGSNGILLVTEEEAHFLTDGRYREQANTEVEGAEIHVPGYKLFEYLAEHKLFEGSKTCIVQGDHLSVDELDRLRGLIQGVRFEPEPRLLVKAVASKSKVEIDKIQAAQTITDTVFADLLQHIKPGISEQDISAEIVYQHLKRGCDWMSFEPIVAAGVRGALPHARPTNNAIRRGDMVVIDMGGVKDGYASDMTRTVAVGEPGEEARVVYQTVLDAQNKSIDAARAGMTGRELDRVGRSVIEAAGYGEAFSHSLGHGIGLQTHEWPALSSRTEDVLPIGATVTIEPGIYLPGKFGVRIEDIVVLGEESCTNLTRSPKELLVL